MILLHLRNLLLALPVCTSVGASPPKPKTYDTHDYYAVHLTSETSPEHVAQQFGLEFVEPLGALDDHYIFRSPLNKDVDVVQDHLQRLRKRDMSYVERQLHDSVLFAEKQKLKRLVKREPPPSLQRKARAEAASFANEKDELPQDDHKDAIHAIERPTNYLQTVIDKLEIKDPIFNEQWHLYNPVQLGHDINVTGLWFEGVTGKNVTVAIIDDGLDMESDDLKSNYFAEGSWDFNDPGPDPKPRLSDDRHGTRCAGEVAAARNDICGVGVAYDAKVAGIRILSKLISDMDEAAALNYKMDKNNIYSCSWGPTDDGMTMEAPSLLIKRSILTGIQKGRGGKGSIFVFASGNGANNGDNCNFDGYTNSIYSITVTAIDRNGDHPYYAESCSANLVVTYSSGGSDAIHTTDVGQNACYTQHGGTSAAAPLGAGIFALVLSVRPDLTWRDLQYLCVNTAVPVNTDDEDWQDTVIGRKFNHRYGYGKLDAYTLVHAAESWVPVKPQAWYHSPVLHVDHDIPEGDAGLTSEIEITADQMKASNIARLEHVTVTMNVEHTRRGDISVNLISPKGIISKIATERPRDASPHGYVDWTFMTVKHWGEDGIGKWKLIVHDTSHPENTGKFIDWRLNLWGESIDGEKQGLHPLPGAEGTDQNGVATTTSTVGASTISISKPTKSTSLMANPSDHPDRPEKVKPTTSSSTSLVTSSTSSSSSSSSTSSSTSTSTSDITSTSSSTSTTTGTALPVAETNRPGFIPPIFPTFGVSAKKQAWLYGVFVIIVLFISGLGVYFCLQRRQRQRSKNSMNDYEFAMLDNEGDVEGGDTLLQGKGAKRGKKGRDLYDAFGESDDDAVFSSDDENRDRRGSVDESEEEESTESYQDVPSEKEGRGRTV